MAQAQALLGRTIAGRFRVVGFIGEGAMAEVYRAEQDAEPHVVALKVMHPHLNADPTFAGRFRREAKAAAQLDHPNTVRIVEWGADGKLLYMAMELLEGKDLFDVLVVERRLPEARAARVLIEICDALATAHEQGIVHRDLKPENIMVMPDPARPGVDRVKVLDFGIAKILERDKHHGPHTGDSPTSITHSALTTVGTVVGTPAYMSPEQCRGEGVDARSDLYSCGALLYQLLTGHTPFTGDTPLDIALKQVRMPATPPTEWVPTLHPGLVAVVIKALEKWPAQRHQDALAMRDELTALLPELSDTRDPLRRVSVPAPSIGTGSDARTAIRKAPSSGAPSSAPASRKDAFAARRQSSAGGGSGGDEAPTRIRPAYPDMSRAPTERAPQGMVPGQPALAPPSPVSPPVQTPTTPFAPGFAQALGRPPAAAPQPPQAPPAAAMSPLPPPRSSALPPVSRPAGPYDATVPTGEPGARVASPLPAPIVRPPLGSAPALPGAPIDPPSAARAERPSGIPVDPIGAALASAVAAAPAAPAPPNLVAVAPAPAAAPKKARRGAWVLVPLAILVGMAVGAVMFRMMR
jgi:serine/threonine-protein kinase